jgi:hypothetical protein
MEVSGSAHLLKKNVSRLSFSRNSRRAEITAFHGNIFSVR